MHFVGKRIVQNLHADGHFDATAVRLERERTAVNAGFLSGGNAAGKPYTLILPFRYGVFAVFDSRIEGKNGVGIPTAFKIIGGRARNLYIFLIIYGEIILGKYFPVFVCEIGKLHFVRFHRLVCGNDNLRAFVLVFHCGKREFCGKRFGIRLIAQHLDGVIRRPDGNIRLPFFLAGYRAQCQRER